MAKGLLMEEKLVDRLTYIKPVANNMIEYLNSTNAEVQPMSSFFKKTFPFQTD